MAKAQDNAPAESGTNKYRRDGRWFRPRIRAKGYAEERKAKVHQRGEKEGQELTEYEKGLRSGYLLSQNDNAGDYSYFIKGTVRGKDARVLIVPPDNGGYKVLDIVFGAEMEAELVLKPYEITDENTGKVIKGNTYAVHTQDEDGTEYECAVKPFRASDKTLLNMLLNKKPPFLQIEKGGNKEKCTTNLKNTNFMSISARIK